MKPYQIRATRLTVIPTGDPIFSEMVTHIEIDDEASGEFLRLTQQSGSLDAKAQSIAITPGEWPHVRQAIETMIEEIHSWENDKGLTTQPAPQMPEKHK